MSTPTTYDESGRTFENGLCRILTDGRKRSPKVHLMKPGGGLVCRPNMPDERMAPTDATEPTCGLCARALAVA